jgi:hypothetical protein
MREKIESLVKEKPKHYSKDIKKDPEMKKWVEDNSLIVADFPEMVYSALNQENPICCYGNKKRFIGINDGFRPYCGMTKNCKCAQITISEKVSATKSKRTQTEINEENKKRELTNIQKYGVANAGQTNLAKQKHQAFYADDEKVKKQVAQYQETMMVNHGVKNAAHIHGIEEVKKTTSKMNWGTDYPMQSSAVKEIAKRSSIEKYGVDNPCKNDEIKDKISANRLSNSFVSFKKLLNESYELDVLIDKNEFVGTNFSPEYTFECLKCGDIFNKKFLYNHTVCRKCHPILRGRSLAEIEVFDFISANTTEEVLNNVNDVISPYELDIYIPTLNLAIEYCGLFWHDDNHKDKMYHIQKQNMCREKGVKLITIFEDEWLYKQSVAKQRLLHALPNNRKSLYARKCELKEISNTMSNKFVEEFHLQGKCNADKNFGLFDNDVLVAVMTFGKSRFNKNFEYELIRFCSSEAISGGASKLFSHFVKTYNPKFIVSYSDNRWGDGGLYEKLGFEKLDKTVVPTYYYTDYQYRYNRQKFQKHKLVKEGFDASKSESEIMKERGFGRIWDCGQTTWQWVQKN